MPPFLGGVMREFVQEVQRAAYDRRADRAFAPGICRGRPGVHLTGQNEQAYPEYFWPTGP